MSEFKNKVVMITGAAGQVAHGMIEYFGKAGARLSLLDYNQERVDHCVPIAQQYASEVIGLPANLAEPEQVQSAVDATHEAYGTIDVLIHTAGGFAMGDPVHAVNMDVFEQMMMLNARLTYVTCGTVAKYMVEQEIEGSLVAILAKAGLNGGKNMAAYSASKAAAERIVQAMALELKDHNIRINGIMPSIVDTETNRADMPKADFSKWVTPMQLAETTAFLASSTAISGASVPVYGRV